MKRFKGKAIYQPSGKASEYAEWACNFYVGCSNGCEYCYLKKGRGAKILGGDKPTLKTCFNDKTHALEVFEKELAQNFPELQKHGLFFSFTTDPMLPETFELTCNAIGIALHYQVPVKILTKCTDWVDEYIWWLNNSNSDNASLEWRKNIAFGFTLTGHDELEPGASSNAERIEAMKMLHEAGFRTFASIEPIIDFDSSFEMIKQTVGFCELYKVGLESGKKYKKLDVNEFLYKISILAAVNDFKVYPKDSLVALSLYSREFLETLSSSFVDRSYNIFKPPLA